MSSGKESKPWSFGLFGGKGGSKSIFLCIVFIVIAILTHIGGAVKSELNDRRQRPALALKSTLRDVRDFIRNEKRNPTSFREIEMRVWNKSNPDAPSRLNGPNIWVYGNYEYIFFAGDIQKINIINIWAIPLGKYRDEFDTVLLVIKPDGEDVWRGAALNPEQHDFVAKYGFNPTFPQMAQLNMKKDAVETAPKK